jgi:hypothetical protein
VTEVSSFANELLASLDEAQAELSLFGMPASQPQLPGTGQRVFAS